MKLSRGEARRELELCHEIGSHTRSFYPSKHWSEIEALFVIFGCRAAIAQRGPVSNPW